MNSIEQRAMRAQALWASGRAQQAAGRLDQAHAQFREAHDLVVDCPRLHQTAHQHLRALNGQRRAWRELGTDLFLLGFARLGVFELVALLMKRQVLGGLLCDRKAT
jgi:hypothetical protein